MGFRQGWLFNKGSWLIQGVLFFFLIASTFWASCGWLIPQAWLVLTWHYIYLHIYIHMIYVCTYSYIKVTICMCMYTYRCIHIYIYIHVYIYRCIYFHECVCNKYIYTSHYITWWSSYGNRTNVYVQ